MHPDSPTKTLQRWRLLVTHGGALVVMGMVLGGSLCFAGPELKPSLEYEVKGAFLVKFGMFVEWPTRQPESPAPQAFLIGILGADPFGADFEQAVAGRTVRGLPVRLKRAGQASELQDCQIVYLHPADEQGMIDALKTFAGQSILTVSDVPDFTTQGGMIGFIKQDGKVRFEINVAATERSRLKLSSKLLQIAHQVKGTTGKGK